MACNKSAQTALQLRRQGRGGSCRRQRCGEGEDGRVESAAVMERYITHKLQSLKLNPSLNPEKYPEQGLPCSTSITQEMTLVMWNGQGHWVQ